MRRLAFPLLVALLLAGCGNERQPGTDLASVSAPIGQKRVGVPEYGLSFVAPGNWQFEFGKKPRAFRLYSGAAQVTGWVYTRKEPRPRSRAEFRAALRRLRSEVTDRNPKYAIRRAWVLDDLQGRRALELRGDQAILELPLRTRSVHFFRRDKEYVIELLAPPEDYEMVNRHVMQPLLDSVAASARDERTPEERAAARARSSARAP